MAKQKVRKSSAYSGGKKLNMKLIEKEMHYFLSLFKYIKNKKQREALIDNITNGQLKTAKHLVKCFLNHKINVKPEEMEKLKRAKRWLYGLSDNRVDDKVKKKILKQKGGVLLGPLIGALAPALIEPVIKPVMGIVGKVLGG